MEELDKGLEISLHGKEAQQILKRIGEQMEKWGLVMPPVEPLILDFGLGDFCRIGETEFWIANEIEGGYCGKFFSPFCASVVGIWNVTGGGAGLSLGFNPSVKLIIPEVITSINADRLRENRLRGNDLSPTP